MAYESVLNTPFIINTGSPITSVSNGSVYSTTAVVNISGTTWGAATNDDYAVLTVSTSATNANTLSAVPYASYGQPVTSSILIQLSSASTLPNPSVYQGYVTSSTVNPTTSAVTLTINFISPELATTVINLSANATTTVVDPTKSSVVDNFFFVTSNGVLRTTHGHARIVAQQG